MSDNYLKYDDGAIESLKKALPWMDDPLYFKSVRVAAPAAMKMLSHAVSGVEKGMKKNGTPVEIMGLLTGHLCPEEPTTIIVTDAFPLPIEGAETRVVADDQEVVNYMIELGDMLEMTRKDRFMGWYHSHPFDVEVHSHCFLSSTDVQTQLQWQRSEDRNGNPWFGIVVDPLRSLAKGRPEVGAFRAYPPEYTAPQNLTPDGTYTADKTATIERWGVSWDRYTSINIEYFMSSLSSNVLKLISRNHLWMSSLTSTPTLEKENRSRFAERVRALTSKLNGNKRLIRNVGKPYLDRDSEGIGSVDNNIQTSCELSVEQLQSQLSQVAKYLMFAVPPSVTE